MWCSGADAELWSDQCSRGRCACLLTAGRCEVVKRDVALSIANGHHLDLFTRWSFRAFSFSFLFSLFSFLCRESFRYDFDSLIIEWIYFPAVLSLARGYTCTQRPQQACALTQHRTCSPLARSPCRATAGSQLGDNQPRSARFICTPSAGTISIFLRNGCFWRKSVQWAKKHLSLEIERSGACGYWPSSFSSAFWMVSCVLLYYYYYYYAGCNFVEIN